MWPSQYKSWQKKSPTPSPPCQSNAIWSPMSGGNLHRTRSLAVQRWIMKKSNNGCSISFSPPTVGYFQSPTNYPQSDRYSVRRHPRESRTLHGSSSRFLTCPHHGSQGPLAGSNKHQLAGVTAADVAASNTCWRARHSRRNGRGFTSLGGGREPCNYRELAPHLPHLS